MNPMTRILFTVSILFVVACAPAPTPYGGGADGGVVIPCQEPYVADDVPVVANADGTCINGGVPVWSAERSRMECCGGVGQHCPATCIDTRRDTCAECRAREGGTGVAECDSCADPVVVYVPALSRYACCAGNCDLPGSQPDAGVDASATPWPSVCGTY